MRLRTLSLLVLALVLSSCSGRRDDARLVPEETFVRLYADVLIGREESSLRGAAASASLPDSLSRAYNVSGADFARTLSEYQADVSKWKHLHEKVVQRLEQLQQAMASKRLHR